MTKNKVIFLGPLPPPHMGPTVATEIILRSTLKYHFELIHLDTSDHRDLNTLGAFDSVNFTLALKHYILLFWLIITSRPDLVYIPISQTTVGYLRDSIFIMISGLSGRKVVCHLRGGDFGNWYKSSSSLMKLYVRSVHRLVDGQIVLGKKLRGMFQGIVEEDRIYVVHNGRDFGTISQGEKRNRAIRVLFLSNFIRSKGVVDVIRAANYVSKDSPGTEFILAGSWRDRNTKLEIEGFLKNHPDLPVDIKGPVFGIEKYRLFSSSDIFVYPTYYPPEGHPWVLVEAMAHGLPVITTDQGAITEAVIDGRNGFIIMKKSPILIAEKINLLINNGNLRKKMGNESRRIYAEKFTEANMIESITMIFNDVLSR